MKKHRFPLFLMLTAILFTFTFGFFLGRNQRSQAICAEVLPTAARYDAAPEIYSVQDTPTEPVFPIDINTADLYTLTSLPGIGQTLARRIILYRDTHGPFPRVQELLNVEGIGAGTLEGILDYVTTGG